jgi:hypothetical protein
LPRNKAHQHVRGKNQAGAESERSGLSNRRPALPTRNRTRGNFARGQPLAKNVIVNANTVVVKVQIVLERPRTEVPHVKVKARSSKLKRLLDILKSSGPTALNLIEDILRFLAIGK